MRRAAAAAKQSGLLSLWAGQGVRMLRERTAPQLMAELKAEIEQAWQSLKDQLK